MFITRSNLFLFSFLALCLANLAHGQNRPAFLDENVKYLWPTNASNYMSSSFAETRSAHFHAALDIGTWGQTGYQVYASRDGIVHKVGVGPRGYGNVIHLKHDDGSFSLYAHLKDFVPEIRSVVDSIRFSHNYSFTFNEELENHNIRFKQGDLIGISGDTGVGPPHLHFELRTPSGLPFNPLLTNISIPDAIPPRFVALSVEPISPDALVEGEKGIFQKKVIRSGTEYQFGTIAVKGSVGLGIDVFDQANGANNVYAVYDLRLKVNGELYFQSRVDSFSYNDTHQMFLDRVYPILRDSGRSFQRLYVKDSNRLPFYVQTGHSGVINLPPGRHHFEIIAQDFFGNTSRADGHLLFEEDEFLASNRNITNKTLPKIPSNSSAALSLSGWHWNSNWVSPKYPSEDLYIALQKPGSFSNDIKKLSLNYPGRTVDLSGNSSAIITLNDEQSYLMHRVHPGNKSEFYSSDQRASVAFSPGSVYDTMSVGLKYKLSNQGLPAIRIYPEHHPIHKKAVLSFVLDKKLAKNDNLAFYYKHPRRDEFRMIDTDRRGAVISGEITHFDTFYVLEDSLGPEIADPKIYRRRDGKWEISVKVKDDLSGIDYHASEFYWNDIRGIAEYDPENNRLRYHHPDFMPASQNRIRVIAADRVGNVTYKNFDVRN